MANISYWYDEYKRETNDLVKLIESASNHAGPPQAQNKLLMDCDSKINRVKDVKKSFGLELRVTTDRSLKSEFDKKAKDLEVIFNKAVSDLADIRNANRDQDKKDLMAGNKSRFNTEGRDNDDLLNDAYHIQDETKASIARSKALVEASEEIGTATLEVLVNQREQINEISDEIDVIDSNLTRAEKLITAFARRMATDRVLQFFTAVNIILIIAVVAYAATHQKKLKDDSSDGGGGP